MSNIWSALEGGIVGVAVANAGAAVVDPALEPARQQAWKDSQAKIHELPQLATLVAQGLNTLEDVEDDAARNGWPPDALLTAVQLALRGPGLGEAIRAYQRNGNPALGPGITEAQLQHAFAKAQLEYQYWAPLEALAKQPLDPAVLANAIVRGIIQAPFDLPYQLPGPDRNVASFPTSALDATNEAAASGIDVDRLFVETAIAGRPMAPEEAADAYWRGIITHDDYLQAILEGDLRGEWADALLERSRMILTPHEAADLRLRGVVNQSGAEYLASLHGMSTGNADLLYEMLGRGISLHEITTGLARGGTYNGDTSGIPEEYLDAVSRSDVRPEFFNLWYANRFTIPDYFVIKAMLGNNSISVDTATELFLQQGWDPAIAEPAAAALAPAGAAGKALSVTQIRKGFEEGFITEGDALARIEAHGYIAADAAILLGTAPQVGAL